MHVWSIGEGPKENDFYYELLCKAHQIFNALQNAEIIPKNDKEVGLVLVLQ